LLDTYFGQQSDGRVLEGQIQRGTGETIRAVIWLCNLRGFTGLSESLPREALIDLPNCYFGPMCDAGRGAGRRDIEIHRRCHAGHFPIRTDTAATWPPPSARKRRCARRTGRGKAPKRHKLAFVIQ
jgi:adenylate cyclase